MRKKPIVIFLILVAVFLIIDIVSKVLVFHFLNDGESVKIIPNVIEFTLVKNDGVAFGWFSGGWWLTIVTTILTVTAIIFWWVVGRANGWANLGFALFIAGASGNLFDRFRYGYVRDFIDMAFADFPVFNIADICLNLGTGILVIYFIVATFKRSGENKR